MLNTILGNQSEATTTHNAQVLTLQWNPKNENCSQLKVDESGAVSVSPGALSRDKIKPSGSPFFEPEKIF